jgi:hypothetical protein
MTEDAFSAWVSDRAAAVDAIMIAPTRHLVALLNRRAREHRLDHCAATVEVALADGNRGSVGDVIITRRNDRRSASPPTMQLGQAEGVVDVLDVAEDTAGTDRGELLIISDQPYVRAQSDSKLDGGVQGQSVAHARFVDDQQGRRADRCRPIRQLTMLEGPDESGEGIAADPGLLREDSGRGSRRGQAEHLTAVWGSPSPTTWR